MTTRKGLKIDKFICVIECFFIILEYFIAQIVYEGITDKLTRTVASQYRLCGVGLTILFGTLSVTPALWILWRYNFFQKAYPSQQQKCDHCCHCTNGNFTECADSKDQAKNEQKEDSSNVKSNNAKPAQGTTATDNKITDERSSAVWRPEPQGILFCLGCYSALVPLLFTPIIFGLTTLLSGIPFSTTDYLQTNNQLDKLLSSVLRVLITTPINEELVFRLVITKQGEIRGFTKRQTVFLSSIMFSLIHLTNMLSPEISKIYVCFQVVMSLFYGMTLSGFVLSHHCLNKTTKITIAIVYHMLNNVTASFITFKNAPSLTVIVVDLLAVPFLLLSSFSHNDFEDQTKKKLL